MALALCLCFAVAPASAAWMNGNWVTDAEAATASHDSVTGVDSKYVETSAVPKSDGCGELNIQTLTHHALIGSTFTIQKVNGDGKIFTNGDRATKEAFESFTTIADNHTLELDHNGRYNDRVMPGVYRINLLDGNGGQPEYAIAEVVENQKTDVVFLGHGVSMGGEEQHKVVFTIIEATYGATECNSVVDAPAHTEYQYWIETTYKDEQYQSCYWHWGKYECHTDTRRIVDVLGHWSAWGDNIPQGYTEQGPHACKYKHKHVDATYKTVCTGETIPVTQNVQDIVNMGYTSFFFFDNAQNHGGIFSEAGLLLSQIQDPAVGIVKNVYIHYTRDGEDKTIDTMEYQKINL